MGYLLAAMVTILVGAAFLWILSHDRLWRRQFVLVSAESIYGFGAISILVSPEFDRWLFGVTLLGSLTLLVLLLGANSQHPWLEPFFEGLDEGIENVQRWR